MIDLERLPDVLAKMQPEHIANYALNLARRHNALIETCEQRNVELRKEREARALLMARVETLEKHLSLLLFASKAVDDWIELIPLSEWNDPVIEQFRLTIENALGH